MKLLIISLVVMLAVSRSYTLYKQCDSKWSGEQLGTSSDTICKAGCLVSSVAMLLNTYGVKVNSQTTNPSTMNTWLKSNGGYVSGDLFVWGSISKLGFSYQGKFTAAQAKTYFDQGKHVILNVRNGGHYVLMTSYSGDTFSVNDPGFSVTSYKTSEITTAAVYTFVGSASHTVEELLEELEE